ncbi:MAG TPA: histidinol-phosphate transaminase [Chloroflexota bacterium]|nr:histidinol-phosphate transaminase [Chloroflexota bacterium]
MTGIRPRLAADELAPVVHGGAPPHLDGVLDFSASANPLGPAPGVVAAARAAALDRYPERESATLRAALAARLGVHPETILVGNGTVELFWLLGLCFLGRGDVALVVGPTFGEYARAAALAGARVVEVAARADDDFQPDWSAVARAAAAERPRLSFVCNPNNPTGVYCGRAEIEALLANTPGLLVLDEAYLPFVVGAWDAIPLLADPRLVLVRSLTKDHAIAGLRLGYVAAAPDVVRILRAAQPTWSVNAAAQAAGLAALEEDRHVERGRALAEEAKVFLAEELRPLGWRVLPSAANFLLVEVGEAAAVTQALRAAGIYVRDCTSFGLPRHIRLAARPLAECAVLVAAARQLTARAAAGVTGRAES